MLWTIENLRKVHAPAVGLPAVGGTNPAEGGANLHPEASG